MLDLDKPFYMRRSVKLTLRVDARVPIANMAGHIAKVIEDSGNIAVIKVATGGVVYGNPAPKALEGESAPGKLAK